jgi:purine-binding chemotaxis protein CheW
VVADLRSQPTPEGGHPYLTFALAGGEYGVDILRVQEIRRWEPVTRVPNAPPHVKGVLNLRGAIVPVLDLRKRFGLPEQPCGPDAVVVVLRAASDGGERSVGLVVDGVSDVLEARDADVRATPDFGRVMAADCIAGLTTAGQAMVMLLDVESVLDDQRPLQAGADTKQSEDRQE